VDETAGLEGRLRDDTWGQLSRLRRVSGGRGGVTWGGGGWPEGPRHRRSGAEGGCGGVAVATKQKKQKGGVGAKEEETHP
jgi:hypothetical protein